MRVGISARMSLDTTGCGGYGPTGLVPTRVRDRCPNPEASPAELEKRLVSTASIRFLGKPAMSGYAERMRLGPGLVTSGH